MRSFALQLAAPSLTMIEIFVLMALTYWVTRRRIHPDMAARAPGREVAKRETLGLLAYAALGQVGGWILGPALGFRFIQLPYRGYCFWLRDPAVPGGAVDLGRV